MFSLTFATTYILYAWIPALAFWLNRRESRGAVMASLGLSVLATILAFIGIVSLVSAILEQANFGNSPGLIAFSVLLILSTFGAFTLLTGYNAIKSYYILFKD